jgi:prepilin-type N-terminal cleavage/methylation domain-containing protein
MRRASLSPAARRVASERGFTIVEVLVAVFVVSLGLLAVVGPLESAGRTAKTAERTEQLVSWGQREIERLRTQPYADLGHTTLPSHEGSGSGDNNPRNPDFYVQDGAAGERTMLIKQDYNNSTSANVAGTPANGEELVAGGTVVSEEDFSVAGMTGQVYRFVSWRRENCTNCAATAANGRNTKRVTVAVVADEAGNGSGAGKPIWLSTVVIDPSARPPQTQAPSANPGAGTATSGQPFFLHDVSCKVGFGTGDQTNQEPTAHTTHNTSEQGRSCADDAPNSPDSMNNVAPRDFGYSLPNFSEELTRSSPTGGAVLRPFDTGCPTSYAPTDADARKASVHTWATPTFSSLGLASGFSTPASGARSAFTFATQTVNGVSGGGTLCLTLRSSANPSTVLASTTYTQPNWPTEPTELTFAFDHAPFSVAAADRLLLTVSVKSDSPNDIGLLYDHPQAQSFLSVSTTTPIGG